MQDYQQQSTVPAALGREGRAEPNALRRGGVYLMPNGTEVVAGVPGSGGRRFFYHPLVWQGSAWIISMPVAYEIIPDGSIVTGRGVGTGWSAGQVLDTGRTTGKP